MPQRLGGVSHGSSSVPSRGIGAFPYLSCKHGMRRQVGTPSGLAEDQLELGSLAGTASCRSCFLLMPLPPPSPPPHSRTRSSACWFSLLGTPILRGSIPSSYLHILVAICYTSNDPMAITMATCAGSWFDTLFGPGGSAPHADSSHHYHHHAHPQQVNWSLTPVSGVPTCSIAP